MDYAKDLLTGKIVAAEDAASERTYACPRPDCGGRVYLPEVVVQRPHFRHYPNEGTTECDEYFPGIAGESEQLLRPVAEVEEHPSELGLVLTEVDGRWGLGLRLPEIPSEELGETSLAALRPAFVDVHSGSDDVLRVSALELRFGIGALRVDVAPSLRPFRTQPTGSWPATIAKSRWLLDARGLDAKGALFRLRRGEWVRLRAGSAVHHSETLLVLADARFSPPDSVITQNHDSIECGALRWAIWEVHVSLEPSPSVSAWLTRLGHRLVPRSWSIELALPPRAYGDRGEPIFWIGDMPVFTIEAPQPSAAGMVGFHSGSNSYSASVQAPPSRFAHGSVSVRDVGLARLVLSGDRRASLDIAFIQRPSTTGLGELLAQAPRLRIQIGQQVLEAWQETTHTVTVRSREQPEINVHLGDASARARITVWEKQKQRGKRGLDARGIGKAIASALATADRIEVDADNLGRVVVIVVRAAVSATRAAVRDRLAWHDYVVDLGSDSGSSISAVVELPGGGGTMGARQLTPAALVRSRLRLRRGIDGRGPRS